MKKQLFSLILICLFVLGANNISPANNEIIVCGTGDSQKILQIMANDFQKVTGTNVAVPDSIGSIAGIKATAAGKCDLGRTARPLNENEKKYNLVYKVFAYSPVVIALNPSVKGIDNLTSEQLVAIYSGKVTLWSGLGGEKTKIYIVNREAKDSSRRLLDKYIHGFEDIKKPAGKILYTTPKAIQTIQKYQGTIGYGPLAMVNERHLKIIKIDGVFPSLENIQNKKYKIVVPLGLVWKGKLSGESKRFVDFIFSPEGEEIINKNGAISAR